MDYVNDAQSDRADRESENTELILHWGNPIGHITDFRWRTRSCKTWRLLIKRRRIVLRHGSWVTMVKEYGSPVRPKGKQRLSIRSIILDAEMMMMTTASCLIGPGEMTNKIFAMEKSFYKPNSTSKTEINTEWFTKNEIIRKTAFCKSDTCFASAV